MGRKPKLTEKQIEEVVAFYKSGTKYKDIASKFGVSMGYVLWWIKKKGITRNRETGVRSWVSSGWF